jgi:predicted amidophosphoribosyltransferase
MRISPIKIFGNWQDGYVLDEHTVSSSAVGGSFDTIYTELGGLLYDFKYNKHLDTSKEIWELTQDFLLEWLSGKKIDFVINLPPSTPRIVQPLAVITKYIANRLKVPYVDNCLINLSEKSAKNGAYDLVIEINIRFERVSNVLLVDDLYNTGTSLLKTCEVLKSDDKVGEIYVLALTRKRNKGTVLR